MANDWFKLNATGTGTDDDPYRPDFKGHDVDGFAGNEADPNGGPPWLVRVYADSATLDALEADLSAGEQRLSSVPDQALNAMAGQTRDAAGWNDGFNIGGGA